MLLSFSVTPFSQKFAHVMIK